MAPKDKITCSLIIQNPLFRPQGYQMMLTSFLRACTAMFLQGPSPDQSTCRHLPVFEMTITKVFSNPRILSGCGLLSIFLKYKWCLLLSTVKFKGLLRRTWASETLDLSTALSWGGRWVKYLLFHPLHGWETFS